MDCIEGWNGRVSARGVNLSMDSWKVKPTTTKVPSNDFESRYRKGAHGLKGAEVEFSGYVDRDSNVFTDAGGGLRAGERIPVYCYLIKGNLVFTFPYLNIYEVEVGDELDGRVSISCRGESYGAFTYPGGVLA